MFDYSTLVNQVRRTLGDKVTRVVEEIQSFQNDSYYITLGEEGYISIISFLIDEEKIDSSKYTLNGNIIKMKEIIASGSSISIEYDSSNYSDEDILNYIGDTISGYIEALTNTDYLFGQDGCGDKQTNYNITSNEKALFVHGTVLNIVGINLLEATGDTIYIKDGDTTINTSVSSKQISDTYKNVFKKFMELLKTVRTNQFQGEVLAGW